MLLEPRSSSACSFRGDELGRAAAGNLLLIGMGPHARRTYLPHIQKHSNRYNVRLSAVVELESRRSEVEALCGQLGISPAQLFVSPFRSNRMPADVCDQLDALVARHGVNGVIISTEPLAHRVYLEYALQRNLNVLVDKPMTTRIDVAHDLAQAQGIWADFRYILGLYRGVQRRKSTCLVPQCRNDLSRKLEITYLA